MHKNDMKTIILHTLLKHKIRTLLTLLFVISSIVLQVLPPLILANVIDALTKHMMVSFQLAGEYFLLIAASGFSDAAREAMIVQSGEGITHALRYAMMEKIHHLPAAYFTQHEAGEITSIQVNDVDAIEDMFSSGIVSMFTDLGTVISILIVIFTKSKGLGILLLIALPLLSLFTWHVQKEMLKAHTKNRKATADANGILPETMHIIRSLHIYQAEKFAEKRYDQAIQDSFSALEKTNYYDAVYSPVILTVSAVIIGIMMSLSGQSGTFRNWFGISVGTAVAMIAYVNNIFTPLSSIGMEIQTVQSALAGWKRVQNFLNAEERLIPPLQGNIQTEKDTDTAIEIENLSFGYDKNKLILKDFSLQVKKGEFVTITGRTGIGKSTLFKLLLGLYEPQKGRIYINGITPQNIPETSIRKMICCVEQKVTMISGTIADQITLGNKAFTKDEIWQALTIVGLKNTILSIPNQLDAPYIESDFSQGQKQLLMIARAIVSNPYILLLDEITSGLDSGTEKLIIDALINASKNRTVLSISHRLSQRIPGCIYEMS